MVRKRRADKSVRFADPICIAEENYSSIEETPNDDFEESKETRNDTDLLDHPGSCHRPPLSQKGKSLKGLQTVYLGLGQYSTIPQCD